MRNCTQEQHTSHTSFVIRILLILLTLMDLCSYFWSNSLLKTTCWHWPSFQFHTWTKSSSTAQQPSKAALSETKAWIPCLDCSQILWYNTNSNCYLGKMGCSYESYSLLGCNASAQQPWLNPAHQGVGFVSSPKGGIWRTSSQLQLTAWQRKQAAIYWVRPSISKKGS